MPLFLVGLASIDALYGIYERYLNELLARMGMMVDAWGHSEANPLGIAVFCHSFDKAIQTDPTGPFGPGAMRRILSLSPCWKFFFGL